MANGTFTYGINLGNPNPPVDFVRLLVADTVQFAADNITPIYIFSDQEILAMEAIVQSNFQSAQFFSTPGGPPGAGSFGVNLPPQPIPYYRVAGMLLNSLAANSSRLASVTQLLDVKLNPSLAAKALKDQAQAYFDQDDNSGAFVVIEQVNDSFSFADRFWKQWQRMSFQ